MRQITLLLILLLGFINSYSQEVDLLRLAYDRSSIQSNQMGMAVSPDGKLIAFVYEDKTIKIFDISIGRFVSRFTSSFNDLFDVQFGSNQELALVESAQVRIIDLESQSEVASFPLVKKATKTAYSGEHNLLAVGQMEGYVQVFDLQKKVEAVSIQYKKHHVSALAIHPNGKSFLVGVMSFLKNMNPLKQYDISTGKEMAESPEGINGKADTNMDKKLTIRELSTYIENKVPELSEQLKGSAQYPSAYSFGNDFPIVVFN